MGTKKKKRLKHREHRGKGLIINTVGTGRDLSNKKKIHCALTPVPAMSIPPNRYNATKSHTWLVCDAVSRSHFGYEIQRETLAPYSAYVGWVSSFFYKPFCPFFSAPSAFFARGLLSFSSVFSVVQSYLLSFFSSY